MSPATETALAPFNRKYLGSKRLLRKRIADRIVEAAGVPGTFLDGFCGTGAVSLEMLARGAGRVTAVDSLRSNCVVLRGACGAPADPAGRARLLELLGMLNGLEPRDGYITESYAGTYFTAENCARMDAVREIIAARAAAGDLSPDEHDYLLASFLLAADRVANTLGQYVAFLKHIGSDSVVEGRHLRDQRVRSPFRLRPLAVGPGAEITVLAGDLLALAAGIRVDAAYYDPPYNGRQYCDNYHVLENIARWEKPALSGKTRKFDRTGPRSPFSRRADAARALQKLVQDTPARHVFLSYSSEGILSRETIRAILELQGTVREWEFPYPVFGNGAGVSARRSVTELLFHLLKGQGA